MTLREMREQAKKAFDAKHKEDIIVPIETTGNKGVTVSHSWEPDAPVVLTKEEKLAERELDKEIKFETRGVIDS